jgi:hypothetical protein
MRRISRVAQSIPACAFAWAWSSRKFESTDSDDKELEGLVKEVHERAAAAAAKAKATPRSDITDAKVKLAAFVKSADPVLVLKGLNSSQRFGVHTLCKELGLRTRSDADKAMHVTRGGDVIQPDTEGPIITERREESAPVPKTTPQRTAAPVAATKTAASTQPTPVSELPNSPQELMALIDKLSESLKVSYGKLQALREGASAAPLRAKEMHSVAAEGPADLEYDEAQPVPQLADPLSRQEINVDSAAKALGDMRTLERTVGSAAIATIIGHVCSAPSLFKDEANDQEFCEVRLRVNSPIVKGDAGIYEVEVRAYAKVLSRYLEECVCEGDMVHVLGHVLPDLHSGRVVVVLAAEGCHAAVVLGAASRT